MDLVKSQISGMVTLGLGTMVIGLLPGWFSTQRQQWPLLLSLLLCFGGGVLFSTSIIHILPELRETTNYAEFLICAGFFILYLIDELVHFIWSRNKRNHHHDNHRRSEDVGDNRPGHSRSQSLTFKNTNYNSIESTPLNPSENNLHGRQYKSNIGSMGKAFSHNDLYHDHRRTGQMCHTGQTEPCNEPPIGQMGLLIALSIHSVLEGLAIGLENSVSKVWLLVGAVASHKLVVGFCLGAELASSATSTFCKHFVAIFVFAMGSVGGIGIGMIVTDASHAWSTTVQIVLQGLAGGTLLYVTMCEVLPRERAKWHNKAEYSAGSLGQFFSVLSGFVLMSLITKYLDVDHSAP